MRYKISALFLSLIIYGCAPSASIERLQNSSGSSMEESFKLEVQTSPPEKIQSVQLYSKGSANNPPAITLNSSQKLVLEFDHLSQSATQFKIRITHRSKDWTESPLSSNFYLNSFNEFYFGDGLKSFNQRPSFFHYSYEFPNDRISFKTSGNYLIEVFNYNSNELLFSLPFLGIFVAYEGLLFGPNAGFQYNITFSTLTLLLIVLGKAFYAERSISVKAN